MITHLQHSSILTAKGGANYITAKKSNAAAHANAAERHACE